MLRVKTFNSAACNDDTGELEALVNVWLHSVNPNVQQMTQTAIGTHVVLTFLFDVHVEVAEMAAEAATEVPDAFEESLDATKLDPEDLVVGSLPQAELPY